MKYCLSSIVVVLFSVFFNSSVSLAEEKEFDMRVLLKIEQYLNGINSIKSNFVQLNSEGSLSEGVFYLKKPGKFRWEYQDQPIIIVANGKSLIYHDTELDQVNYVPIEQSIASLLVRRSISFASEDLEVVDLVEKGDSTRISLIKRNQKDVGEFSFLFQNDPFKLGKIELLDNQGQKISVTFFEMEINGAEMNKKLFQIKDPRLK